MNREIINTGFFTGDEAQLLNSTKKEFKERLDNSIKHNIEKELIIFRDFALRLYPRSSKNHHKAKPLIDQIEQKLEAINFIK